MLLTPGMAEAFGDQLECESLRRALVAALPEAAGTVTVDEARPLLRIARASGGALLVARAAEEADGRWLVGIPATPDPILHATATQQGVLEIVLPLLARGGRPDGAADL